MPFLMINKGNQYRTLEVEMELLLVAENKFWCMFFLLSTYMSFYVNVLYSMHFMYVLCTTLQLFVLRFL